MSSFEDRPEVFCRDCLWYGGLSGADAHIVCIHHRAHVVEKTPLGVLRVLRPGNERNANNDCADFSPLPSWRRLLRPGGVMMVVLGVLWLLLWLVARGGQ